MKFPPISCYIKVVESVQDLHVIYIEEPMVRKGLSVDRLAMECGGYV